MKKMNIAALALTLCAAGAFAQTTAAPANALPDAPSAAANIQPEPQPTGPTVVLDTTMGRIVCKLFMKEAPITSQNFIDLAEGKKDWDRPYPRSARCTTSLCTTARPSIA